MKIGSLCTGYGGLDMAAENVFGATTAWVSDIDKGACKIIAHRYPNIPNIGDMTAVDWASVEPVDIITGGTPCQDLSHAGKRAGMTEGTRSNLWVAMREAINIIRPQYVIWENVRGAYSAGADSALEHCPGCMGGGRPGLVLRALGRVLGDLSDLGYDCQWRGLRAADVGAPHGRFRVFVVAHLADTKHLRHERAGQARGWRAGSADGDSGPVTLLPTPAVNDMGAGKTVDAWDAWTDDMRAKHGNGNGHGASLHIEVARLLPTPTVQDGENTAGPSTFSRNTVPLNAEVTRTELWGQYANAIARWEHTLQRPAPDPTEPTGRNNAPRLSPKFTEWMMGVPQGWITDTPGITRNEALKACGNGVVPQQAEAALRHMLLATAVAA